MIRHLSFVILCWTTLTLPAIAAPIHLIDGAPASYIPGESFAFVIRLPPINNLGSYNVDVVVESDGGTAGVDFFFDVAATSSASSNYIFPSHSNFFDAVNVDSTSRHRLTLTDFYFPGVNVAPETNYLIARVILTTSASFSGQLNLTVDAAGLQLDTPDLAPTSVSNFELIRDHIIASGPVVIDSLPEPSSIILVLAAIAGLFQRSRDTHRLR